MRVLMSGGGTGGHINPALAIAGKIKKECPDAVIEYVGTEHGLETSLVPKAGYPIHYVKVEGLKRKICLENVRALTEAVTSVIEAKKIIRSFKPDIVIGTGGYVCWPVLRAAAECHIPTVVHESNALPGVATKALAHSVDRILVNFAESASDKALPKEKTICVGNPVDGKMFETNRDSSRSSLRLGADDKLLLSYGGSLGAKKVNETVFAMIEQDLLPAGTHHIHATGNLYWQKAKERFLPQGFAETEDGVMTRGNATLRQYIYNMNELLSASDVVICRAGAMTVSETAAMGKAAIFIPSPNVTDNHQYKNAAVLYNAGAAELIEEKDLSEKLLADTVIRLFDDDDARMRMMKKIRDFADRDCLDKIYAIVRELTGMR